MGGGSEHTHINPDRESLHLYFVKKFHFIFYKEHTCAVNLQESNGSSPQFSITSPTSGRADLRSNLVDKRCQVQSPVTIGDINVRSFPWFSPKPLITRIYFFTVITHIHLQQPIFYYF